MLSSTADHCKPSTGNCADQPSQQPAVHAIAQPTQRTATVDEQAAEEIVLVVVTRRLTRRHRDIQIAIAADELMYAHVALHARYALEWSHCNSKEWHSSDMGWPSSTVCHTA
jgi:hypothetical protein